MAYYIIKTTIKGASMRYLLTWKVLAILLIIVAPGCSQSGGDSPDRDGQSLTDALAPTVRLSVPEGYHSRTAPLTLTASFSEVITGLDIGDFTVTGATKGAFEGSGRLYTLILTPASTNVDIRVTLTEGAGVDAEGNKSIAPPPFVVRFDSIAPENPGLTIESNAIAVAKTDVTLQLTATGASQVYITNTEGCAADGQWDEFSSTKSWTLPNTNANNTVYAKYRDFAGNETDCLSDAIAHDTVAPTDGTIALSGGAAVTHTQTPTLALSATGATQMYLTNTAGCASDGTTEAYATSKAWTLAGTNTTNTVYVKYLDDAGNESTCINATITHDSVAPGTPTFSIPIAFSSLAGTLTGDGTQEGFLVLRSTATIGDTPTTGTAYSTGDTIGSSTVAYSGTTTTFTDSAVVTGDLYYYAAYAYDAAKNYSAAIATTSNVIPAGTLDTNWNTTGYDFRDGVGHTGGNNDDIRAIAVDSSGRTYACGHSESTGATDYMILMRYTESGSLDTSFNEDGIFLDTNGLSTCYDLVLDSSGYIYASGIQSANMMLWKFTPSGELDSTFGTSGTTTLQITNATRGFAIALDSSGRILVAGHYLNASFKEQAFVARFSGSGSLDTSWATSGILYPADAMTSPTYQGVDGMALDSSDNLYLSGFTSDLNPSQVYFALWKYSANGTIDTTFSADGIVSEGSQLSRGYDILLDDSSRVVVSGQYFTPTNGDWAATIWRFNTDGSADTTFNSTGTKNFTTISTDSQDTGYSLVRLSTGHLVMAGYTLDSSSNYDIALWVTDSSGAAATSFNSTGQLSANFSNDDLAYAIDVDMNGRFMVGGTTARSSFVGNTAVWVYK